MMVTRMNIMIEVPPREEALSGGCSVPVSRAGVGWSESCLGSAAKEQGVYVIHHSRRIKYVGKTDGPTMSFGMRLRREFQESASQRRHIYPRLEALLVPPEIRVFFFFAERIRTMVSSSDVALDDNQRIAILETVLTQLWRPDFQIAAKVSEALDAITCALPAERTSN
jgi:hypothetical protein